ncbi:MAG: protein kinase [Terriglobales bacterium]
MKVLDFGLARRWRVGDAESTDSLTRQGAGTLPYMAPEQFRDAAVDLRSDIWAAGVVLYEMATGRRCFNEPSLATLMEAILRREPLPPASVNRAISPGLDRLCRNSCFCTAGRKWKSRSMENDLGVAVVDVGPGQKVGTDHLQAVAT